MLSAREAKPGQVRERATWDNKEDERGVRLARTPPTPSGIFFVVAFFRPLRGSLFPPTDRPSVHPFVLPFTFFWTAEARGRTTESPSHRCRRRRTLSRSPAPFSINPLSGPHDRRGDRHTRRSRPWVCEIFKSIARARPPRYTQFSPRDTAISPRCFLKLIASKCQKG